MAQRNSARLCICETFTRSSTSASKFGISAIVLLSVTLLAVHCQPVTDSTTPAVVVNATNSTPAAAASGSNATAAVATTTATPTSTTTAAAAATTITTAIPSSTTLASSEATSLHVSSTQPATTSSPPSTTTQQATSESPTTPTSTTGAKSLVKNEEDIEEIKRHIHMSIAPHSGHGESRLSVNKPSVMSQAVEFAPDSIEAKISHAATDFALEFIKSASKGNENVVMSPISLQSLLNMVLLGSTANSVTYNELAKTLGYEGLKLIDDAKNASDRMKPHEAMRSVFESIVTATHLSLGASNERVKNERLEAGLPGAEVLQGKSASNVGAHLQTSLREDATPLSGQLNFTVANLVLTNRDMVELNAGYEKDLKSYYNVKTEVFTAAKETNTSDSSHLHDRVNDWVRNETHNQISQLVTDKDLESKDLAMILLNVAHFKGRWLHTFEKFATHPDVFFNNGDEKQAKWDTLFMRQKASFEYLDLNDISMRRPVDYDGPYGRVRSSDDSETLLTEDTNIAPVQQLSQNQQHKVDQKRANEDAQSKRRAELSQKLNCSVLSMPFSLNDGQELSMVLLLPATRDGVSELQAKLNADVLTEIYGLLHEQQVQVELPKFSFESTFEANEPLKRMGLKSLFDNSAQLGTMFTANRSAHVDKIIHKAKIQVDETGAEASAASVALIHMRTMIIDPPTPIFRAEHPFLFIIRHNRSGMPLFMGRINSL